MLTHLAVLAHEPCRALAEAGYTIARGLKFDFFIFL